jgi:hypothetical protein
MNEKGAGRIRQRVNTYKAYRKYLISVAVTVSVYAILGFFLAPWLVKKTAIESVSENLHAILDIGKVAINPFILSLNIEDSKLTDDTGNALATVDQIYINFQLSSVFRWALTFDEFHVVGPELFLARDASGAVNAAGLLKAKTESEPAPAEESAASPPRLLIFDFAIRDCVVNWNDQAPVDAVETVFGPVDIVIAELNTLPRRAGRQEVVIVTETQGTFGWSGTLQLNPFNSIGHATITGSHFPLTSAYMRHQTGFDIVDGTADARLDYSVMTNVDGTISAAIDNFNMALSDVLVRTFHGTSVDSGIERDLFSFPKIEVTGGALHWPERKLAITSLSIDDAAISLYRKADGVLDIGPTNAAAETGQSVATQSSDLAASDDPWKLSLQQLAVKRLSLDLIDDSVVPQADIGLESIDLSITSLSNESGASFPTVLRLVPRTGGTIALDGTTIILPEPLLDFALTIENLQLAGAHPYLKTLADVNLDSGALNMSGRLQSSSTEPLMLRGDLDIVDFLITETDEGSRLGSWTKLDVQKFAFSSAGQSLEVSEIHAHQIYGDILIAKDGSVNLGRVQKADANEEKDAVAAAESAGSPFEVTIGRVVITKGAADFADLSLPLPFAATITNLNGDMSTIATSSSEPSTVSLEGKVDQFGFLRVSGNITPLDTSRNTDLKVSFQNVEMPKFSAYTIPFAGREIASGKLDLDLGYKVTESELIGENKIVLRDLELGDKVPHPGAMSLPLGLAVALLKDSEGKIDIDLPVRGNVDDPEFRYGRVVLKAIGGLIVKIAASPFALLGKMLGVESSDLEYVAFPGGRSDLLPPEIQRAGKLAEALALRPELVLELPGVVDKDVDGLALKTARVDDVVEQRLGVSGSAEFGDAMYATRQKTVLEQLFTESDLTQDAAVALETLRLQFITTTAETERGGAGEQFDELAYTAELRLQLIGAQRLDQEELDVLASERSANTRAAILIINADLAERIVIGQPQAIENSSGDEVLMKVRLRTGSGDDENE